jgi:hypothetical protein
MARQQRGGGGDVARGAGYAALLGALLIGVAVVIGIVLLQIGDNNDNGPSTAAGKPTTTTKPVTTTTRPAAGTTTTAPATPAKAPSQVSLIVLNGGAKSGKAGDMSDALKTKGYTNQPQPANDWTGHNQTGDAVYCKQGLDREGAALAVAVGSVAGGPAVPLHVPYPTPPPPFSSSVKCVVVVGASAGTTTT